MIWLLALAFLQDDTKKIAEDVGALKKDVAALASKMDQADRDVHAILKALKRGGAGFPTGRMGANERNAAISLMGVVTAEENFKSNDVDRNGVGDYWTGDVSGLYWIVMNATYKPTACLSDLGVVYADVYTFTDAGGTFDGVDMDGDTNPDTSYALPAGLPRSPKAGYWYQALINDADGNAYAQDTDGQGNCHNYGKFAFAAIPVIWNSVGRSCYIVNEQGQVYRRDFGATTVMPVPAVQVSTFDGAEALDWPSEAELKEKWVKVELEGDGPRPPVIRGFRNAVVWRCTDKKCKGSVEALHNVKAVPKCPRCLKDTEAPEVEVYVCSKCKSDVVVEKGAKAPKCCGKDAAKKEK